ncbi:Uncharacterised protein [Chromobacterium violaceum]|uniref:Uncharacterized protein n=1 Tax=Chromobacterium violaceum TaxID=536 RepID=A0A447TDR6_CHRVL|nr:Uncharacterised protein [Chromobacterium violaceum]
MQIDVMPFMFPIIRVGALLLMALIVGMFAAAYVNHRMLLMDYRISSGGSGARWRSS